MERAPFGWNQPADFNDDDWPIETESHVETERHVETETPAHTELRVQTDRTLTSEPPLADFDDEDWPVETERAAQRTEILAQTDRALTSESRGDPDRPAYSELPLNFERYHAAYEAEKRWYVNDTPKLGGDARIAYVLFAVALAVAGVWGIQRYVEGPVVSEEASQAVNDPPRAKPAPPRSSGLGPGTPVQGVDDLTGKSATADLRPAPSVEPSLPGGSVEPGGRLPSTSEPPPPGGSVEPGGRLPSTLKPPPPGDSVERGGRLPSTLESAPPSGSVERGGRLPATFEPPPLKGTTEDPGVQARTPTPPPVRKPLVIAPPPRPPYQPTFGESAPSRATATEPTPSPTPAPVPTPATSVPSAETAPSSPRVAVPETVPRPLPRTPVEEPALASPATPPPAAAATPPSAAAPAPTAAARPAADVESGAIRDVLGRYRSAFNTLDAKAAQQVWPSVNEQTLDRAFGQLEKQNVSFDTCTIYVKGVVAEANCRGTTRFVPRVGSRAMQVEARQWSFSLRKANSGGWLIQEVEAR